MNYKIHNGRLKIAEADETGFPLGAYVPPPVVGENKIPVPNGYEVVNGFLVNAWTVKDAPVLNGDETQIESDKDAFKELESIDASKMTNDQKSSLISKIANILKTII